MNLYNYKEVLRELLRKDLINLNHHFLIVEDILNSYKSKPFAKAMLEFKMSYEHEMMYFS